MPLKKVGELSVPSTLDHLADVDQFTEGLFRNLALPREILDDVAISISEAVNNAMVHGNKLDPARKVLIRFYVCSRYLRLVVRDQGTGFQPETVPDPRQEQNLLKTSGRGLLIMRHLMDRVTFQPRRGGMQIVMDKYCPQDCYGGTERNCA
ncbi:MAG: ATP-binding protein [Candidatus Zixiibacteriota bacterium]|nr:MAG: ATP-binding protein [candidate division Zixibacteria bacterium]